MIFAEVSLNKEGDTIKGVEIFNQITRKRERYYAPVTVNAGGIWGQHIASLAGVKINMFPAKGALLIFGHRVNNVVINRCRKPANADILVPGDTICLIGTTSSRIPFEECDRIHVTPDEVDILLKEGEKLAPKLASTRILRAYAGVRPLVATDDDPSGRNISRGIVLLDHETRDGVKGFISITGGKLMTYRLMAEWATDLVCRKLGIDKQCVTMDIPLPGSETDGIEEISKQTWAKPATMHKASVGRHGFRAGRIDIENANDASLVCECEEVSVGEVRYAIDELDVHNLVDLRRRTRVGMGTCQGELCACRASGLLAQSHRCADRAKNDLKNFINERWKGMYPICWGDTLRESEYSQWVYSGVCGLEENRNKKED